MVNTVIRKKLGNWLYGSGQRISNNIDRDGILYQLDIDVSFTITNGGTGPVGPLAYTLARIIQRFEVQLNGKDTIINTTGEQLVSRALLELGQIPYGMDATVVLTNSAVTNYRVIIPVPLFLPHSVNPRDTGLECRTLQQVTLAVTFATSDCAQFFTTPNSAALSNVQCTISGEYYQTDEKGIMQVSDPNYLVRTLDWVSLPISASNTNLGQQMDRGPQFYRSFHVMAQQNYIQVDNVVNNLKLQSGSFVFTDQGGAMNRAKLLSDNGLYATPAAAAPVTGVYSMHTAKFGSLGTAINVDPKVMLTDLFAYFDVTFTSGNTQLLISREAVRKPNI